MDGKTHAIIIDHVGNVVKHGLPDSPRIWTLDRRDKRGKSSADDSIPVKVCTACMGVYEAIYKVCPYCNHEAVPMGRSLPEMVDGDLTEMSSELLARLRGEITHAERSPDEVRDGILRAGMSKVIANTQAKNQRERLEVLEDLRNRIRAWGSIRREAGQDDATSYREFYLRFGVDVLSAQTLKKSEMNKLIERIK